MRRKKEPDNSWNNIRRGFIVVFLISVLMAFLEFHGAIAGVEGKLQDLIWLQNLNWPQGDSPPHMDSMVIFAIDNDAYRDFFGEASPLCPNIVTSLVGQISSEEPAVIGVDILTEATPSQNADSYRNFSTMKANRNVVWASSGEPADPQNINIFDWFRGKDEDLKIQPTPVLAFSPTELKDKSDVIWGPAIYPTENDLKLRRFPRELHLTTDPSPKEPKHTWARLIAKKYCDSIKWAPPCKSFSSKTKDVFLNFAGSPPPVFSIGEFFNVRKPDRTKDSKQTGHCDATISVKDSRKALLRQLVHGQIALLGGAFSQSGDFHATPAGQKEAGIVINARAIAAEIEGKGFNEIEQPWSFLLDLLFGSAVVLLMASFKKWLGWEPRNAKIMLLTSLATAVAITIVLYKTHYLFSPAAVAVAALIQQLYDFWHENPRMVSQDAHPHTVPKHPRR